jgi:hypothetical protein
MGQGPCMKLIQSLEPNFGSYTHHFKFVVNQTNICTAGPAQNLSYSDQRHACRLLLYTHMIINY